MHDIGYIGRSSTGTEVSGSFQITLFAFYNILVRKILNLNNIILPTTKALAKFGRTVKCWAFDRYQSVVFGLTFSNPPADFATLLVCWLVWWLHQNLRSLICASAGRTQQQMPKPRQCSTLAASPKRTLYEIETCNNSDRNCLLYGYFWRTSENITYCKCRYNSHRSYNNKNYWLAITSL